MKIYPCGTEVKIPILGIHGYVSCIKIEYDAVIYVINYCMNLEVRTIECCEKEFEVVDPKQKKTIGYK